MSDIDERIIGVVVAFLTTLWTWVAFAGTMAPFSGDRAVNTMLGPNPSPSVRRQVSTEIPGYAGTFVKTLTFGDRQSWVVYPGASGWEIVGQTAGESLKLVAIALVLALVIAVPFVLVSQVDLARPFLAIIGLLGGLSTLVWCLFVLGFAPNPGSHIDPEGLGGLFVPAATLAVPLGLAAGRIASRYDLTDTRTTVRDLLLDGWLYVAWIPGALVLVEQLFAVTGLGYLWYQALVQGDFPLFTLLSSVLVAPVVFCAFLRELGLALTLPAPGSSRADKGVAGDGAPPSATTPFHAAFSTGGVALLGGVLFSLLFLGGLVGSRLTSRSGYSQPRTIQPYQILDALAASTSIAVLVLVVAILVGIGLGVLGTRTPVPRHLNRLFDPLTNVPFVVFLAAWLIYSRQSTGLTGMLIIGGVGGLAVAPMVARRFEREAAGGSLPEAALPSLGLAASGTALIVFVSTELGFLALTLRDLSFSFNYPLESLFWSHLVFIGLPAMALLLLGEGLRRYEPIERGSDSNSAR